MTLYWVRHGPTHAKVMTGWRDVPADLSDHARLDRLSAFLPADAPVVSSDLIRAVTTADALIARAPGRKRQPHHPGLREFHFGDWEGKHHTELNEASSRRFWDEPGDTAPPGGESWNDVLARVSAAADELADVGHRNLIFVAHMGAIMSQIARTGLSAKDVYGLEIAPLSVTILQRQADSLTVQAINHQP